MNDDSGNDDVKRYLLQYLQEGRDAILGKLDGLSEYDVRRPLTPTGTNLLGLVKHLGCCEAGYFGEVFDRPARLSLPGWDDGQDPTADLWATAGESREQIIGFYQEAWRHSDATIAALELDAPGRVRWWGESGAVTLHHVLVHMIAETLRHTGHADILREGLDGSVGMRRPGDNVPDRDTAEWAAYRARLEAVAREAAGPDPAPDPAGA